MVKTGGTTWHAEERILINEKAVVLKGVTGSAAPLSATFIRPPQPANHNIVVLCNRGQYIR